MYACTYVRMCVYIYIYTHVQGIHMHMFVKQRHVCHHRGKSANNLSADASEIGLGLLLCRNVVLEFRLVVYPSSFG